jgi:hypothetical protein
MIRIWRFIINVLIKIAAFILIYVVFVTVVPQGTGKYFGQLFYLLRQLEIFHPISSLWEIDFDAFILTESWRAYTEIKLCCGYCNLIWNNSCCWVNGVSNSGTKLRCLFISWKIGVCHSDKRVEDGRKILSFKDTAHQTQDAVWMRKLNQESKNQNTLFSLCMLTYTYER